MTPTRAACATCAFLIAQQVAGKSVRDALYVTTFGVTALPVVMVASAILSCALALGLGRLLSRTSPRRVLPWLFLISGVGLFAECAVSSALPRAFAVLVYGHHSVMSPVLISSFWAYVNERYDPYDAKRAVARITRAGTVGGLVGGVAMWRAAPFVSMTHAVLGVALLNVGCYVAMSSTRAVANERPSGSSPSLVALPIFGAAPSAFGLIAKSSFLRSLGLLVAVGAAMSSVLDYLFSARATLSYGRGEPLLELMALFSVVVAVLSLVVSSLLGHLATKRLSLTTNLAILPAILVVGSGVAFVAPGLASIAALRSGDLVYRNTLFRAAYELLYTPVAAKTKRAAKGIIDVGLDRAGTAVGGGLAACAVMARDSERAALLFVLGLTVLTGVAIRALHAGYLAALEQRLRDGAGGPVEGPKPPPSPAAEEKAMDALLAHPEARLGVPEVFGLATIAARNGGALGRSANDLLSHDQARARQAFSTFDASMWPLTPLAIILLGDAELYSDARAALSKVARGATGQLLDALLDAGMDETVRRRLPPVLSAAGTQAAADGLLAGSADPSFEVRFACARALFNLTDTAKEIVVPRERVVSLLVAEASRADQAISRSDDDARDREDISPASALIDVILEERMARSLQHVFTLLALIVDREPLRMCVRALHHGDARHRGTALEYLQNVLPAEVLDAAWPLLTNGGGPLATPRPASELLAELRAAGLALPLVDGTARASRTLVSSVALGEAETHHGT